MPAKKPVGRLSPTPSQSDGPATDANNSPVVDPTENVLRLVEAAIRRQDDLRNAEARFQAAEMECTKEISKLRAEHDRELRLAEAARIDAIRAVDVGNVSRAAEVAAQQAQALATQLATTAETMRVTVAAAAGAAQTALAAALEPIQKDVTELRQVQFQQQGERVGRADDRLIQKDTREEKVTERSQSNWLIGVVVGIALFIAAEFLRRGVG